MEGLNKSFKKFLLLWSGELISAIGSGLTSFGLGIYVYAQTGRVSSTALITLLAFLPSLLLSPIAGVLADRYDRRFLMILGDSLSALGLIYILVSMINGEATLYQIAIGVTVSSIFSSLLEPAYKATITDLLTKEDFSKASGLVQMAGSSKFLISPILAGFLLSFSNIKLLLIIDICTFFITVTTTLIVRKDLPSKAIEKRESIASEFKDGWKALTSNKGIFALVILGSILTLSLGIIQTLATPMILSFSNATTLGVCETICGSGMLVSSIFIGMISIKKGYSKILAISLFMTGIFMAIFGLRENIILISLAGFLFFATLPFANTSIDVLVRSNIPNEVQGRAWGVIGLISQLGYVIAFGFVGIISDNIVSPMLTDGSILANSVGKIIGTGTGRGSGLLIIIAGLILCITAIVIYSTNSIRKLEDSYV